MTEHNVAHTDARLRDTLARFAGLGENSRGRRAMEALTQEDDDISIRVTDIDQGTLQTEVYQEPSRFKQRLETSSAFRIITIYSESTIDPLQITPDLMEHIISRFDVDHAFLHIVASFGDAPHISESSCSSVSVQVNEAAGQSTVMYQIRYAEENLRRGTSSPWSLRHTGVYHRHRPGDDLFIVLQPTVENPWENRLLRQQDSVSLERICENAFSFHALLFSCYFESWRWYLRHLGDQFSSLNDLAMIVKPERADAGSSFSRVQNLRHLNDFALFTSACCRGDLEVLEELLRVPVCSSSGELRGEATRMRGYAESADVLQSRIRNSIDLVGYTLTLHNQLETAKVDSELRDVTKELKKLTEDTVNLTAEMKRMTQDTVDDSVTVKIITFVSAFYIPGSFVGTLFGMNFFIFDPDRRRIVIAHDFWIFIATWLPLTMLTVGLYLLIVWLDARWNQKEVRWPWKLKRRREPSSFVASADLKAAIDMP